MNLTITPISGEHHKGPSITTPHEKAIDFINNRAPYGTFKEIMLIESSPFKSEFEFTEFISPTSSVSLVEEELNGVERISVYKRLGKAQELVLEDFDIKKQKGVKIDVAPGETYIVKLHRSEQSSQTTYASGKFSVICWVNERRNTYYG